MAEPLWRECINWLVRCKMLKSEHFPDDSDLLNFSQFIRDGVLLCHLIIKLDPSALDPRDVCQHPQLSQYVSLKNIRVFLRTCKKFGLDDSDLFEPTMLFNCTDFGRVIDCLSKLSKCPKFENLGIEGFPCVDYFASSDDTSEEKNIYKHLEDADIQGHRPEYSYAPTDENIYEDLCSMDENKCSQELPDSLQEPTNSREHSIREIIVSEKKFVSQLTMIKETYIKPLANILTEEEKKSIFYGIDKLHDIHAAIFDDLIKACSPNSGLKLHQVFIDWKEKLVLYGDICSNIPLAQQAVEQAISRGKFVADEIEQCKRYGNFHLKDVITLPVQRVLKYHLLLQALCSHTDKTDEDYDGLQLALEAMLDLSEYLNEAKRDYEMRQIVIDVQASISDWGSANNISLIDFGYLIHDGEIKMRSHLRFRKNVKLRYAFLFSKAVVFCKSTQMMDKLLGGDQYTFRLCLELDKYRLEDYVDLQSLAEPQEANNWTYEWTLVDNQNKIAFTLYAKTPEAKNKWMRAFSESMDDLNPLQAKDTNHCFELYTYKSAENCDLCKNLFKGTFFQGYKCTKCNLSAHKKCLGDSRSCGGPGASLSIAASSRVPSQILELEGYPWYAGQMDREKASTILRNAPVGTYLIRYKSEDNSFALSLKSSKEVKHMKVVERTVNSYGGGQVKEYYFSKCFFSRTLAGLVDRYTKKTLHECFTGLHVCLELPWMHAYPTANA